MNEENGNRGGKTYASLVKSVGEEHIMAFESDRGGFSPRGFSVDGSDEQIQFLKLLNPCSNRIIFIIKRDMEE